MIKSVTYTIHSKKYGDMEVLLDEDIYDYIISNGITLLLHCAKRCNIPYVKFNICKDGKRTTMLLHRLVAKCSDGLVVDHINRNPLDNRRSNLRVCRTFDNCQNKSTTVKIGVGLHKASGRWRAYINIGDKQISLGYFDKYEDAVDKRLQAELEYFGGTPW